MVGQLWASPCSCICRKWYEVAVLQSTIALVELSHAWEAVLRQHTNGNIMKIHEASLHFHDERVSPALPAAKPTPGQDIAHSASGHVCKSINESKTKKLPGKICVHKWDDTL